MRYLPVSKARARLAELVDSVERTVITRNGEPVSVLLHVDDFRASEATRRLAAHPELLSRIQAAHEAVVRGEWDRFVDLEPGADGRVDVDAAEAHRGRPVAGELEEALEILAGRDTNDREDRDRYRRNLARLKEGRLTSVAEVVADLRFVAQRRSLSFREKKMYERARNQIVGELARARHIGEQKAEKLVGEALASSVEKGKRAQAS